MSRIITITICYLIVSTTSFAQVGYTIDQLNLVLVNPDTSDFEQVLKTIIKNTSNATTTFKWERTTKCTHPNYGNSICIGSTCYEQTTDSRTFDLTAGETTELASHLWKNGPGNATATIEVKVYPINQPSNSRVVTFKFGSCTTVSTTELGDFENLQVYPNPTSYQIVLDNLGDATQVQIFDLVGALITTHATALSNTLDLSNYKAGTYVLRFTDQFGRKQSLRTVTKL